MKDAQTVLLEGILDLTDISLLNIFMATFATLVYSHVIPDDLFLKIISLGSGF